MDIGNLSTLTSFDKPRAADAAARVFSATDAIQEVVTWVKTVYVDGNGGLPRGIDERGAKSRERLFNDLGDYLPFFALLDETAFCRKQLADARAFRRPDGLLPPEFRYAGLPCIRSYEHSDYLLGLLDVYEQLPSDELKRDLFTAVESVHRTFFRSASPHSWYFPRLHRSLPLTDWKDGMFIELFTLLSKTFQEDRYRIWAEQLAETVLEKTDRADYPLLPDVTADGWLGREIVKRRFLQASHHYTPVKYLANTLFGILELHKTRPDERWKQYLWRAYQTIERDLCTPEGAVTAISRQDGSVKQEAVLLVNNFPMLDWCVDCAHFLQDGRYLPLAKRIAEFWLHQQDQRTGLLPKEARGSLTDHDNLTDMSIAFYKMAEVTGESRYKEAADRIIEGVYRHHRDPALNGYAHGVDVRTGEKRDRGFKVKFVCLWLKALLAYDADGKIYGTPKLYELLKDR